MKIFISYGNNNLKLVQHIAENLISFGEIYYWNQNKEPGQQAWNTIHSWIDSCDLVIAVITSQVVTRAMAVGNEVGRAVSKGKTVIPIVTPEVKESDLGCLHGITHQRIDLQYPHEAISNIQQVILKKKSEKEQQNAILILGGIIALLTVFSKK